MMIELNNFPVWDIEEETGYKPITTFWGDFSIADDFGSEAIIDTYQRAFDEWKDDYKYLTELVLVLNHKIYQHYVENGTKTQNRKAMLYNRLWREADDYACNNLQGEEQNYYYRITD